MSKTNINIIYTDDRMLGCQWCGDPDCPGDCPDYYAAMDEAAADEQYEACRATQIEE